MASPNTLKLRDNGNYRRLRPLTPMPASTRKRRRELRRGQKRLEKAKKRGTTSVEKGPVNSSQHHPNTKRAFHNNRSLRKMWNEEQRKWRSENDPNYWKYDE